jgi:hypothetical protein
MMLSTDTVEIEKPKNSSQSSQRALLKKLQNFRLAQGKILNTTFRDSSKRNPLSSVGTFGNPYGSDKFNRKAYSKEYIDDFKGKGSPPIGTYHNDLNKCSSFYLMGQKHPAKQMSREIRDFQQMYMTKYQRELGNVSPQMYQSEQFLKNKSCFQSKPGDFFGPKAARHIDVRNYS